MHRNLTPPAWFGLFVLLLLAIASCDRNEIDVAANTDFPPSILSSFPAADGRVVAGDFDVRVVFADGTVSPLQSATVTLMNADMAEITSVTEELSGIQDSVVIDGASFGAANLEVGQYNMRISVTDAAGQTTERDLSFEVSNLPFAANLNELYIAGVFNGWSTDSATLEQDFELTLVDNNIWEIRNIDLDGGAWKLKNTYDWSDTDYGDGDCDGVMTSNSAPGGNFDTDCGISGLVNLRFNDETLTYSVTPVVSFASNTMGLYLLGTINDFFGSEYQFSLTDDNTWLLEEVLLGPGDQYKFAEMPDFQGVNYGDNDNDGVAQVGGSNITVSDSTQEAFYSITFNDQTLSYETELVRQLFPENMGIIGNATPTGWDSDTDMEIVEPGVYRITIELMEGAVKFRADDAWDQSWGGETFPTGTAIGNGPDIPVDSAGTYTATLNLNDMTYNFELETGPETIGIIGNATPGGWDTDTDLIQNEDGTYMLVVGLTDGEVKFRADDEWTDDWGGSGFPEGMAEYKGGNIAVTAGVYLVTFDLENLTYSFAPASIGIIGSATPDGWDSDTDMMMNPAVPGELMLEGFTLTDGEVKFRVNDDWAYNWGGTDFPSGTAVFNGGNIPATAGEYTVRLNVNEGTYSFE